MIARNCILSTALVALSLCMVACSSAHRVSDERGSAPVASSPPSEATSNADPTPSAEKRRVQLEVRFTAHKYAGYRSTMSERSAQLRLLRALRAIDGVTSARIETRDVIVETRVGRAFSFDLDELARQDLDEQSF